MDFNFKINRIIELEDTSSTQDVAKELAEIYTEDGVLVQAKTQHGGHGRYERTWDAKEGGLYISILLRPGIKAKSTANLSIKTGEATAAALKELYGIKTKIKLPNDVLALHDGEYKKISGILIETATEQENLNWLIAGIGVNLNNKIDKKINATSVKQITGNKADIYEFRNVLIKHFAKQYIQWKMNNLNDND